MTKERKSRAFNPRYVSHRQGILPGFEHPFDRELDPSNRWVVLSHLIPWDELCNSNVRQRGIIGAGRKPVNPRIVLGNICFKESSNKPTTPSGRKIADVKKDTSVDKRDKDEAPPVSPENDSDESKDGCCPMLYSEHVTTFFSMDVRDGFGTVIGS